MSEKSFVVIYFHGLGGTADSEKAQKLAQLLPDVKLITLDLTGPMGYSTSDKIKKKVVAAINSLDLSTLKKVVFAGISLGGFFAHYMGEQFDVPYVIVNPVVYPEEQLAPLSVDPRLLADFSKLDTVGVSGYLANLMVALDDEVINPHHALNYYNYFRNREIRHDGGHDFTKHWSEVAELIKKVLTY